MNAIPSNVHIVNQRILVVDDNPSIHQDFQKVLGGTKPSGSAMDAEAAELFGESLAETVEIAQSPFELHLAHQGQEALEMVRQAKAEGKPYALAFVDMRMPPGWDGLTTISEIWKVDPDIQTVICTAYSDRSWDEIQGTLTERERWLVVKKPFDKIEVLQLAHSLTEKWNLSRVARQRMEQLEELVQQRTAALRDSQRVNSEFLANASHELLTPLNAVCGFLDLLETTSLDVEQKDYVEESRRGGAVLLKLINQILDFNKCDAGTMVAESLQFTPAELLETTRQLYSSAAAAKGLSLSVVQSQAGLARWVGPANLILKLLGLLTDNAVKFTKTGSVTLSVEEHPAGLCFEVLDTGIGLSPAQLEWLRIPFAQVDGQSTRNSSGIGLGLPLAKRLVRAVGGELTLESGAGNGTCARFTAKVVRPAP